MTGRIVELFCPKKVLETTIKFYRDELGFRLDAENAGDIVLSGPLPSMLRIQLRPIDKHLTKTKTGLEFHVTDFEAALKELSEAGCVFSGSCDINRRLFVVSDPAGNQIIFRELSKS